MAAIVITNKFEKYCSTCGALVAAGAGVAAKETNDSPWLTFCNAHAPGRPKGASSIAPAPSVIRREMTEDGRVYIQPWNNDPNELALLRSMPGREYNKEGRYWQISLNSPEDRAIALAIGRRLNLKIPANLTLDLQPSKRAERAIEAGLRGYQVEGVDWLHQAPRRLLADDMGLGKSPMTIMALDDNDCVLIICPSNVKYNWLEEFNKWRPAFKVEVLNGMNNFRWPNPGEAVIVSYKTLPSWLLPKKDEQFITWSPSDLTCARRTTLVTDEAHHIKSSQSQQHKKVSQLSDKAKKVWFLTGTPVTNKAKDLLGLLKCLKMFNETFGSFNNFIARMNITHNGYGYDWDTARPDPTVPSIMSRVMLRRTRQEVLPELPDIQYQTLFIDDMTDRLRTMLDKCWTEYEEWFDENDDLPPFEEFSKIRKALATARIPAMEEFIGDCEEQSVPLVVFSAHRDPIDKLATRPGWAVITGDTPAKQRQEIVNAAQAGKYNGIGCTISAGGEGINLTYFWTALFVDLDWTATKNEQAVRRLLRIGQVADKIRVVHMVSNHPLDKRVYQLIMRKIKLAIGVLAK